MIDFDIRKYKRILNYIEIILVLGFMDLKLKYRNSKLGFLWSFLKPLLQFCVYYIVFVLLFKVNEGESYPLRLFFGVIVWTFFAESTGLGLESYVSKASIVKKINIKKVLLPIASYITPALNFALNFLMFLAVYLCFVLMGNDPLPKGGFSIKNLIVWIAMLMDLSLIVIFINIILSNLNAVFRDLKNIWDLILQYGVFMTPILYSLPVPENYRVLYFGVNVLALPIEMMKLQFFEYKTLTIDSNVFLAHGIAQLILLLLAVLVHKRTSDKVADYL